MAAPFLPRQGDAWLHSNRKVLRYRLDNVNYSLIPESQFIAGENLLAGDIVSLVAISNQPRIIKTDSNTINKTVGLAVQSYSTDSLAEVQSYGLFTFANPKFNASDIGKIAYVHPTDGTFTTDRNLAAIGSNNIIEIGQVISTTSIFLSLEGDGRGPLDYSEIEYTAGEAINASTPILVSIKADGKIYKSTKQTLQDRFNVVGFIVGANVSLPSIVNGSKVIVRRLGKLTGFSGLTPGLPVFAGGDNTPYGNIIQNVDAISPYYDKFIQVGIANSATEIIVSIEPSFQTMDTAPIGSIILADTSRNPITDLPDSGYLWMLGQTLDAVTNPEYQALYDVVGNTWGGTDNRNFVLKDLYNGGAAETFQIKYKYAYQFQPNYTPVYRIEYPNNTSWAVYNPLIKEISINTSTFDIINIDSIRELDVKIYAKKGTESIQLPNLFSHNNGVNTLIYGFTLQYVDSTHVKIVIAEDGLAFNTDTQIIELNNTWSIKIILVKNERFNRFRDVTADYTLNQFLDWIKLSSGDLSIEGTTTFKNTTTFQGLTLITNTTDSTNKDTGALVLEGGLGVEKSVNVGLNLGVTGTSTLTGVVTITNTTDASSRANGALVVGGGLGVWKNTFIGGNLTIGLSNLTEDRFVRVYSGDANKAGFEAMGASQGTGYYFAGKSSLYGGGFVYAGDATPAFATGLIADTLTFYRRYNDTAYPVFYCHNNDTSTKKVSFLGDVDITGNLGALGNSTFTGIATFNNSTILDDTVSSSNRTIWIS